MPQKRNPVAATIAVAAAGRAPGLVATMLAAMGQEHERGLGNWQVEWDTLPDLVVVTAAGARAAAAALDGLVVDTERMRANVEASGGILLAESVAMALAESLGKHEAHACVATACRRAAAEGRPLAGVLADDPAVAAHLDRDEIARRLSADDYLGRHPPLHRPGAGTCRRCRRKRGHHYKRCTSSLTAADSRSRSAGAREVELDAAHLANVERPEAFNAAVIEYLTH